MGQDRLEAVPAVRSSLELAEELAGDAPRANGAVVVAAAEANGVVLTGDVDDIAALRPTHGA